ncbi:unnamed protein product [Dracunculus medinensis]|uniref:ENT domain-containing protein n=1 Tax=Dracunculus medinensis TaxID=318479 RepID=A0A0N4UGW1_DRAME|nr:unnamed protein product [Dracunculus medinensis]
MNSKKIDEKDALDSEKIASDEIDGQLPGSSHLGDCSFDDEDYYYLLHVLESEAFGAVVRAMRAQGMLTEYKLKLLEHLKGALFISDEEYDAEFRLAANSDLLHQIASKLNPCYDTYTEWGIAAADPDQRIFSEAKRNSAEISFKFADELLNLAIAHNGSLKESDPSLADIVDLPKAPYVPEKLREFLRYTEIESQRCTYDEILQLQKAKSKTISKTENKAVKRNRNMQNTKDVQKAIADEPVFSKQSCGSNWIKNVEESDESHFNLHHAKVTKLNATKGEEKIVRSSRKRPKSNSPNIISTYNNDFCEKEAVKLHGEERLKRSNSKESVKKSRDDTFVCARALPFIFETAIPGQKSKPPRGNPDKRSMRRASPPLNASSQVPPTTSANITNAARTVDVSISKPVVQAISMRGVPLSPSIPIFVQNSYSHQSGNDVNKFDFLKILNPENISVLKRSRISSFSSNDQRSTDHYYQSVPNVIGSRERSSLSKYSTSSSHSSPAVPSKLYYGNIPHANCASTATPNHRHTSFGGLDYVVNTSQNVRTNEPRYIPSYEYRPSSSSISCKSIRRTTTAGRSFRSSLQTSTSTCAGESYHESTHAMAYADVIRPHRDRSNINHERNIIEHGNISDDHHKALFRPDEICTRLTLPGDQIFVDVGNVSNSVKNENIASVNRPILAEEMRLECDEVMVPEQRYALDSRESSMISEI